MVAHRFRKGDSAKNVCRCACASAGRQLNPSNYGIVVNLVKNCETSKRSIERQVLATENPDVVAHDLTGVSLLPPKGYPSVSEPGAVGDLLPGLAAKAEDLRESFPERADDRCVVVVDKHVSVGGELPRGEVQAPCFAEVDGTAALSNRALRGRVPLSTNLLDYGTVSAHQ